MIFEFDGWSVVRFLVLVIGIVLSMWIPRTDFITQIKQLPIMNLLNKILTNYITFFLVAALLLAFAWQWNNIFHVLGNTDGFGRLAALAPLGIWCVLKARLAFK